MPIKKAIAKKKVTFAKASPMTVREWKAYLNAGSKLTYDEWKARCVQDKENRPAVVRSEKQLRELWTLQKHPSKSKNSNASVR